MGHETLYVVATVERGSRVQTVAAVADELLALEIADKAERAMKDHTPQVIVVPVSLESDIFDRASKDSAIAHISEPFTGVGTPTTTWCVDCGYSSRTLQPGNDSLWCVRCYRKEQRRSLAEDTRSDGTLSRPPRYLIEPHVWTAFRYDPAEY